MLLARQTFFNLLMLTALSLLAVVPISTSESIVRAFSLLQSRVC